MGFMRPTPDHPNRAIFNLAHKSLGIVTFVLSITANFLGLNVSNIDLGSMGYGLMIGWAVLIMVLPLIIEFSQRIIFKVKGNTKYKYFLL